jgi:hypothetical protein
LSPVLSLVAATDLSSVTLSSDFLDLGFALALGFDSDFFSSSDVADGDSSAFSSTISIFFFAGRPGFLVLG